MKKSVWIAIGLFAASAAWIGSGYVFRADEDDESEPRQAQPTLVQVERSRARSVPQYIFAQGSAQPFRSVDVVSQVGGSLEEIEVERGDVVEPDTVVGRVEMEARADSRESAQATLEALETELEGIRELEADGFATESRVRELEARVEEARAALAEAEETIGNTTVTAVISGVVSDVYVNGGQFVAAGTPVVRVIDNSPLRIALQLSQVNVGRVERGTVALVSFATGQSAKGRVCFIAPAADPQSRTFLVEVRVSNEGGEIPSRVSAELRLSAGEATAHFVSPAILSLDEQGELGVKSVDDENRVGFHPAEIVRSERDGIWITGLPEEIGLITVGQGFVRRGEVVRVAEPRRESEEETEKTQLRGGESRDGGKMPTASVQSDAFAGADDLPEPPATEEICGLRGADAAGSGAPASAGADAEGASGGAGSPGFDGSAFAEPDAPQGSGGAAAQPAPASSGVAPPAIDAPPVGAGTPPTGSAPPPAAAPPAGGAPVAPSGAGGSPAPGGDAP